MIKCDFCTELLDAGWIYQTSFRVWIACVTCGAFISQADWGEQRARLYLAQRAVEKRRHRLGLAKQTDFIPDTYVPLNEHVVELLDEFWSSPRSKPCSYTR